MRRADGHSGWGKPPGFRRGFAVVGSGTPLVFALFDNAPQAQNTFRFGAFGAPFATPNHAVEFWDKSPALPVSLNASGSVLSLRGYDNATTNRAMEVREISALGTNSAMATGNTNPVVFGGNGGPNIGTINNGGKGFYNGDLAELIIYSGQLTSTDVEAVENYLRNEYSIAALPPPPTVAQSAVQLNGEWQHVAAVFDAAEGLMKLYVNGVEAASAVPPATMIDNLDPISVGARRNANSPNYDLNFDGLIDEVAVYRYALSEQQIVGQNVLAVEVHQAPQGGSNYTDTILAANPVAYWRLGEASTAAVSVPSHRDARRVSPNRSLRWASTRPDRRGPAAAIPAPKKPKIVRSSVTWVRFLNARTRRAPRCAEGIP